MLMRGARSHPDLGFAINLFLWLGLAISLSAGGVAAVKLFGPVLF